MIDADILNNFVKKLEMGAWVDGGNWEFDWYLDCFFVESMAYWEDPMYLGYEQAILGDKFLSVRDEVESDILARYRMVFLNIHEFARVVESQKRVLDNAKYLLNEMKRGRVHLDKYKKAQFDLSLLMGSVSVAWDKLIGEELERISMTEKENLNLLIKYLLDNSSVAAINKSGLALKNIYKAKKEDILGVGGNYDLLSKDTKNLLKKHADVFGWINTGERGSAPWQAKDFFDQMIQSVDNGVSGRERKNLKISAENKKMIDLMVELNINDNLAADMQVQLDYYFQMFLKSKLSSFYIENIIEGLTFEEILSILSDPHSVNKFGNRANNRFRLVYPENGKLYFHYFDTKSDFENISKRVMPKATSGNIKGMIACLGRVKGVARIVLDKHGLNKLGPGEVLVAMKTQPAYVMAMKKASAIVTDIGGITSHAAIIAREFGIPCVVGTGNATKIIKDGDIVEVNAENGEVKVLTSSRE